MIADSKYGIKMIRTHDCHNVGQSFDRKRNNHKLIRLEGRECDIFPQVYSQTMHGSTTKCAYVPNRLYDIVTRTKEEVWFLRGWKCCTLLYLTPLERQGFSLSRITKSPFYLLRAPRMFLQLLALSSVRWFGWPNCSCERVVWCVGWRELWSWIADLRSQIVQ